MTISISGLGSADRRGEEFETTEPDFWLEDIDLQLEGELDKTDPSIDTGFFEAKTDPARPVTDALAATLPDEPRYRPSRTRDEALASFLETVRRVFGKASE